MVTFWNKRHGPFKNRAATFDNTTSSLPTVGAQRCCHAREPLLSPKGSSPPGSCRGTACKMRSRQQLGSLLSQNPPFPCTQAQWYIPRAFSLPAQAGAVVQSRRVAYSLPQRRRETPLRSCLWSSRAVGGGRCRAGGGGGETAAVPGQFGDRQGLLCHSGRRIMSTPARRRLMRDFKR